MMRFLFLLDPVKGSVKRQGESTPAGTGLIDCINKRCSRGCTVGVLQSQIDSLTALGGAVQKMPVNEVFYNRTRRHSTLGNKSPMQFLDDWPMAEHDENLVA